MFKHSQFIEVKVGDQRQNDEEDWKWGIGTQAPAFPAVPTPLHLTPWRFPLTVDPGLGVFVSFLSFLICTVKSLVGCGELLLTFYSEDLIDPPTRAALEIR